MDQGQNILITGCRMFFALELARAFSRAGHTVYVADSVWPHLCYVSNAVKKSFIIPSPRFDFEKFQNRLKQIIQDYEINMVVPVFEDVLYLAKAIPHLPQNCRYFCSSLDTLEKLYDKWHFYEEQEKLDILSPATVLIQTNEDLQKLDRSKEYALKACYSRGSFSLKKISPHQKLPQISIDKKNPWIAQEWIEGKKYCSYSICHEGKVVAHAVYACKINSSDYCLSFEAIRHEKIEIWVKNIVTLMNLTGQISFDFIEDGSGQLFAIECNPRATSGVHLFAEDPRLSHYFLQQQNMPMGEPPLGFGRKLGFGMLLYARTQKEENQSIWDVFKKMLKIPDVVFCKHDLKPFLLQVPIYASTLFRCIKYRVPLRLAFFHDAIWE